MYINICPGWCFSSNISKHAGGRIVIGWNPNCFTVNIVSMISQLIHCQIITGSRKTSFDCTFVYAMNEARDRRVLWDDLEVISRSVGGAWICMGDFNNVLNLTDRIGSLVRLGEVQPMRACFSNCAIEDFKTADCFYAWTNTQEGSHRVMSKIDRVVANQLWLDMFSDVVENFLPEGSFVHCPAIIRTYNHDGSHKPFRFYNMWCNSPQFDEIVQQAWRVDITGCAMFRVFQRLKLLKKEFHKLNKEAFSEIHARDTTALGDLVETQQQLHQNPMNDDLRVTEREKAKVDWLTTGDENTRMFHQSLKEIRQKNAIYSIIDSNGAWKDDPMEVKNDFLEYYMQLLGTTPPSKTHVKPKIIAMGPVINENHHL
ncbi:uncharacterized protein [Spinacia oleracea]|uniref:Endonuclease/exonuclease/phosphatase domain-containing protein n=1 Tax=Spinacia oleracea TaxID=3562 RepID=A0ABM3QXS9_SPIOL|nr:uncharacterized protein LOC130463127 [Spinacia oleracea]